MPFLTTDHWALWVGVALLVYAGLYNLRCLMVRNKITLGALALGLIVVTLVQFRLVPNAGGGWESTLYAMGIGNGLLLVLYFLGGIGAGCIKMQLAYAAWVGCALPQPLSYELVLWGNILGVVLTAIVSVFVLKFGPKNPETGQPRYSLMPAQFFLSLGCIIVVFMYPVLKD